MYNANAIIKTYYYNAIKTALPGASVFKNYVPNELKADAYYLISNVQNVNRDTINKHNVTIFVTIGIYTRATTENSGITCDEMADALFTLFPDPQTRPDVDGYQVCTAVLESDNELTLDFDNGNNYINRQIIFSHILNKLN